jgi:anti-anti-sigma regulatory factor
VLRITSQSTADSLTVKLEGTLRGPWVDELQLAWSEAADKSPRKPAQVDLAGVTFIDARGRELLLQMQKAGAVLQGPSLFLRQVLDGKSGEPRNSKKDQERRK